MFTFRDNAKNLSLFNKFLEFLYDVLREHFKKRILIRAASKESPTKKTIGCDVLSSTEKNKSLSEDQQYH